MAKRCRTLLTVLLVAAANAGFAQASEILIGTGEFPPFTTETTDDHGCVIKIVTSAYEAEGWTVKLKFMPWPRLTAVLSRGEIDASAYLLDRPDRREAVIFPKNPVTSEIYKFIFPRDAIIQWNTYEDLRGKSIITNSSYTYNDQFNNALKTFDIHNTVVSAEDQNLLMLLRGRADFTVMNEKVFEKYFSGLSAEDQSRLYLDPKPAVEAKGFLVFPKVNSDKSRELAHVFDKGYEKIRHRDDLQTAFETCGF